MRRLKTVRRPPIYPKSPGHLPCSSLSHPLPLPSRPPSVSFGGFGLILPLVVLVSYAMGQPAGLIFTPMELIAFALGLMLMVPVLLDGFSNWLEGSQLLTAYLVLAAVLWAF